MTQLILFRPFRWAASYTIKSFDSNGSTFDFGKLNKQPSIKKIDNNKKKRNNICKNIKNLSFKKGKEKHFQISSSRDEKKQKKNRIDNVLLTLVLLLEAVQPYSISFD